MEYKKVEKSLTDFIINLVGPNEESDKQKEEKFYYIKNLITKTLIEEKIELIPHIYCFGSYPIKTYLQDSDLDITIVFEDKIKNSFITDYSYEFLNKILSIIQTKLENLNIQDPQTFSDINLIFADIKLLKFKYQNLSFDISINNFVGLCKLVFIKKLENIFKAKLAKDTIFKRTIILIKAWCCYEGCILGSNMGLIASYGLEVLVAYVFNKYSDRFQNEFEAFVTFFDVVAEIDWEHDLASLFGTFPIEGICENMKPENYTKLFENSDGDLLVTFECIQELAHKYEKFRDFDKIQNFKTGYKNISIKHINIVDPIFVYNNLGNSISFHNFSKIRKVFQLANAENKNIISMRKSCNAFEYLNCLMKIFNKSLVNFYPDMFYNNLITPKIVITPDSHLLLKNESLNKNFSNINGKNSELISKEKYYSNDNLNLFNTDLDHHLIEDFNKLFKLKENTENTFKSEENKASFIKSSNLSNLSPNKKIKNNSQIIVNREIISSIMNIERRNNENYSASNIEKIYDFPDFCDISTIEELLNNL